MSAEPSAVTNTPPQPAWVWHCSDESIAAGQISFLAILEIFLAMAFFGWISSVSPWPWMTVLGLMAAPMLLLRSPASIEEGLRLLRRYLESEVLEPRKKWLMVGASFGFSLLASYVLVTHWLPGHSGWALFWRSGLVGGVAIMVAFAVAVAVAPEFSGAIAITVAIVGTFAGAIAVSVAGVVAAASAVAGAVALAIAVVVLGVIADASTVLALSLIFGIFCRITTIRLWATSQHLLTGLGTFSANWQETVLVIDCSHLPELLPGAAQVSQALALKGLLTKKSNNFGDVTFKLILGSLIYLPALLYRWNLKASAFIWGPLAWALRPNLWLNEEKMRCKTSTRSTWVVQSLIVSIVIGITVWLAWPLLPAEILGEFPRWAGLVQKYLPTAPLPSVRYLLLLVVDLMLLVLLLIAYQVRAAHGKLLEGAGDNKNYSDEQKASFRTMALPLHRALNWMAPLAFFTVWVFALQKSLALWPQLVWNWLRPWL